MAVLKELMAFVRDFWNWLMPKGIGTKATLAFIIVGYGISKLDPAALKEVIIIVLGFYFVMKAANGSKPEETTNAADRCTDNPVS